jgi:hypothetical protein
MDGMLRRSSAASRMNEAVRYSPARAPARARAAARRRGSSRLSFFASRGGNSSLFVWMRGELIVHVAAVMMVGTNCVRFTSLMVFAIVLLTKAHKVG